MLLEEFDTDFRRDAIEASILRLRETGAPDPLRCNRSFCLPTEHGRRQLRSQVWLLGFSVLMAVCGFGAAGLIVAWDARQPEELRQPWLSVLAMLLGSGGIASLFLPVLAGGLLIRGHLGQRFESLRNNTELTKVMSVGIEDSSTFSNIKLVSDDLGYLGIDPAGRRLIIEGVVCRYIIRAEDIDRIEAKLEGSSTGTEIHYYVDDHVALGITIEKMSLIQETIRQLTGRSRNPAYESICQGLGFRPSAGTLNRS